MFICFKPHIQLEYREVWVCKLALGIGWENSKHKTKGITLRMAGTNGGLLKGYIYKFNILPVVSIFLLSILAYVVGMETY